MLRLSTVKINHGTQTQDIFETNLLRTFTLKAFESNVINSGKNVIFGKKRNQINNYCITADFF